MDARSFFEQAAEAARDAERCRRQLEALERNALAVASPVYGTRVAGGDHDRMASKVCTLVDREEQLHRRVEEDYNLIDKACEVLYGADGVSAGLASLMPRSSWVADAIYYHFIARMTWPVVGTLLGYSPEHLCRQTRVAFDVMDAHGLTATVAGMGLAEG